MQASWLLFYGLLLPAIAVKTPQENIEALPMHFKTQRGNIHARAHILFADPRGYMLSRWRNSL